MTAYQILLHELAAHGRVTYAELVTRHPEYDQYNYVAAVYKARKRGLVVIEGRKGAVIVAVGACPCCGQPLGSTPQRRITELLIRALQLEARL